VQRVKLRSSNWFASELGQAVEWLATQPAVLRIGSQGNALSKQGESAADRLRTWIDSYTVRGSFDDRTLVVLHRERGS
jgi:hypothetical protein